MRDSGEGYISYSNKWIINNINSSQSIDHNRYKQRSFGRVNKKKRIVDNIYKYILLTLINITTGELYV